MKINELESTGYGFAHHSLLVLLDKRDFESIKKYNFEEKHYDTLVQIGALLPTKCKKDGYVTPLGRQLIEMSGLNLSTKSSVKDEKLMEFLKEWVNLWPKGVRTGSRYIRASAQNCFLKMKKFLKLYDYSFDTITKATEMYLEERKREGYEYTKVCFYFIQKNDISDLADYCEKIENNEHLENDPGRFTVL